MKFTVLSHAGLLVSGVGATLVVDPWLVGSCYWRSWWNYPPVEPALVERAVSADYIYITHIHWDHFHGPSLRRFPPTTPVLIPKGHYRRLARDLRQLGFRDIRELRHGERARLAPGFEIASYQMFPFLDSALVIACEGVTLLDANDAKFMGGPLDQILDAHPRPDFVFRSHSSANGRRCFEVIDDPERPTDDQGAYLESFAAFARRSGARYAVPFASNHCFLHRDTWPFNDTIQTPIAVERHFREHGITRPQLKVMVSGDTWCSRHGFRLGEEGRRYFDYRSFRLAAYAEANREKLEASYRKEARARVRRDELERYFRRFAAAIPRPVRLYFRHRPITYVLEAGESEQRFSVDLWSGAVAEIETGGVRPCEPAEVHAPALVVKQCMALDLFSHLPTSKRARYRVTKKTIRHIELLNLLFLLYESELLPLSRNLNARFAETWLLRWREVLLYGRIAVELALGRGFSQARHLKPPRFIDGEEEEMVNREPAMQGVSGVE
jgi:UDP-MurNAc hydroxylase